MDDRAVGYALWLIPEEKTVAHFQEKIAELSRRCNTPEFEAHITLLSGLSGEESFLKKATTQLAEQIDPIEIHITRAGYRESYFQNLFVHIEETESLLALREKAFTVFNHEELKDKTFMPHVSLMYGHLAAEEKERILMDVGHEFNIKCKATALTLVKTEGRVTEWENIYAVDLNNSS